ncbi:hypothetical protein TSAR_006636 [Trichomalopsis sarcophagae]|uniref:Uncharacterized protein n=1 Tax=Trichomalopsis sarcophagae TaxID=543379 RepID=A0A232EXM8_9HYME|nr:hypothetical protein TSAR_006636 [Trichomalopsis sarcophagae]
MKIRAKIVNHVNENWEYFEPFTVGDKSLKIIIAFVRVYSGEFQGVKIKDKYDIGKY